MNKSLIDLRIGKVAKVVSINIKDQRVKQHLLDIGLTVGCKVIMKKRAPSGDPVVIENSIGWKPKLWKIYII